MDKPMSDDKSKAESQFNWEAIKESIERMKPELIACSDAAHKAKGAVAENDSDADRLVELGSLVECLGGMCAPHLMLLHEIAHALDDVHEAEGEQEKRSHRHH
jgi:hypothetical protein